MSVVGVTVYIPSCNYARFLRAAVESVIRQVGVSWELFLINECSIDDTHAIMTDFASKSSNITYINNKEKLGLRGVANQVLALAKGEYIIRLDADDFLVDGALNTMFIAGSNCPFAPDFVYGDFIEIDEDGLMLSLESRRWAGGEENTFNPPPHGACSLIRRRVLQQLGGYFDDCTFQDGWELWHRLAPRNRILHVRAPLFYYRRHESSMSSNGDQLIESRTKIISKLAQQRAEGYRPRALLVVGLKDFYGGVSLSERNPSAISALIRKKLNILRQTRNDFQVAFVSDRNEMLNLAARIAGDEELEVILINSAVNITNQVYSITEHLRRTIGQLGAHQKFDLVFMSNLFAESFSSVHLDACVDSMLVSGSDSIVTVVEDSSTLYRHGASGLELLSPGKVYGSSLTQGRVYRYDGCLVGYWVDCLMQRNRHHLKNLSYWELPKESSKITKIDELDVG